MQGESVCKRRSRHDHEAFLLSPLHTLSVLPLRRLPELRSALLRWVSFRIIPIFEDALNLVVSLLTTIFASEKRIVFMQPLLC